MDQGVTVTGVGTVAVTPDRLRARLRLSCSADGVAAAVTTLTERTDVVVATITEYGISRSDVLSSGLYVEPRWDRHERQVEGYVATHRITVTLDDSSDFGPLITALAGVAGNDLGVDGIEQFVSDRPVERQQAREAAFANAHDRAEHLAGLAGRRLGPVTWVNEHHPDARGGHDLDEAVALSGRSGIEVQRGSTAIISAVTVCWAWD